MKLPSFFKSRQVGRDSVKKIGMYLAGCTVFSIGAYLFIDSRLGTDPLDIFSLGLLNHVPLTIGIAQTLVAVIGTVTFFIVVDGCIQPLMWMNRHLLGFPEYWAAPISCVERNY